MSFGGSAIAYLMIAYGGFTALILSRILVGLIKQTMTISYSMLSACTAPETRSRNVGRIQSSSTAAWILGPSTGALLFKCMLVSIVHKKLVPIFLRFAILIYHFLSFNRENRK